MLTRCLGGCGRGDRHVPTPRPGKHTAPRVGRRVGTRCVKSCDALLEHVAGNANPADMRKTHL